MHHSHLPALAEALVSAVPGIERPGLRERKKAATMHRLQAVAVEQFEEHGFDAVTVEHVAEHAEVSPSTVYRYFGTKEGLLLRDEYDDMVLLLAQQLLKLTDPWTAFSRAIELIEHTHFQVDELALRRVKLMLEIPQLRAAALVTVEETAAQLAEHMHATDRYGRTLEDYQVISASLLMAFFVALEQWYRADGRTSIWDQVTDAVELVRPAWATPVDLTTDPE